MQATIQKWGNSQGIRIPKAFLDALGMKENDRVSLERQEDFIVIKKLSQTKGLTIDDIFSGYNGDDQPEEFDWGAPVGKEIG